MNKIKLSFNKKSKGDILSVIAVGAGVIVTVLSSMGVTISTDEISSISSLILYVGGGLGLMRNTSTGTSQSQGANVSSMDASKTFDLAHEFASAGVSEQAVNPGLTKAERKKAVIQQVLSGLEALGRSLDAKTVAGIVERAYQMYLASGGKSLDVTQTPAPTEVIEPDEEAEDDE